MRSTLPAALLTATAAAALAVTGLPAAAATGSVPRVSAVGPTSGSTAGGSRVTVTGSHFARGAIVSFGRTRGSSVRVLSSSKLQVTAPAHMAGTVDVTVHVKAGTSARRGSDRFTFVNPPSISSVTPSANLPAAGGTRLTVLGHGFTGVTAVRFGAAAGSAVTVVNSGKLQVTAPAHPSGSYDVHVVNRYGSSRAVTADRVSFTASLTADTVVGLDGTLQMTAHGLRAGSSTHFGLDGGAYLLGTVAARADGSAHLSVVMSGQVPDGHHVLQVTGTTGTGVAAAFTGPLLVDVTAPTVSDVTVSSDPAHPGDTVTVTAHVTDDGGVQSVVLEVDAPGGALACGHGAATLTPDGTATDGIWTADCALPVGAAAGTYTVVPWGTDVAGNFFSVDDGPTFEVQPS